MTNFLDMLPNSKDPLPSKDPLGSSAFSETEPHGTPPCCSRKGCTAAARWKILWNNPKIHAPERRKIWLSCDRHQNWLGDYLKARQLWRETVPITSGPPQPGQERH